MNESPQFRTVLRGYDPDEVTAVITELSSSLTIARRTAADRTKELARAQEQSAKLKTQLGETTEKLAAAQEVSAPEPSPDAFVGVSSRLTAILELAEQEASQVRAEGERYVAELRTAAEADVERITQEASGKAEAVMRKANAARREADRAGQRARRAAATAEATRD